MSGIINFRIVFRVMSRNLFILAVSLASCIGIALYYSEPLQPFVWSSLIALALGLVLYLATRNQGDDTPISKKDAYLTVTLSWLVICLIGSFPYLITRSIPLFIDALFESVSGFSTTGASILTDIEALPKSILFWRSLTHWIGGIGIIVLVIIVLPTLQFGGYHLFTLESSLQEKIQPKIRSVGYRLLLIYVGLTVSQILLMLLGKMTLFDSVCHAFGTVATGGFSPKNTSIAGYSPYIQYVIMIFMFLAGTNYVIHYRIVLGQYKKAFANEELRFYFVVVFLIGAIITGAIFFKMGKPLEESFRESYFQVISIISCTGFATADYLLWPTFAWVILFFSMFLGGSMGSTSGGIKMARHMILFKNIQRMFGQLIHPSAVLPIRVDKHTLSWTVNSTILNFIFIYMLIFIVGTLILVLLGLEGDASAGAVATCMAGIGPGLGSVGPVSNFGHLPGLGKLLLSVLMLVGRLEIFTIVMIFSRGFWRK